MPFTNFPQGVTSLGTPIVGGALSIVPTGGNYWFVDSTNGGASNPGTYDAPFATWQAAVTAAAANDIIVLDAAHVETITTAGAVALSKVGLQTIGMGTGSKRPTITVGTATTTTASVLITGAGTRIDNVIFVAGTASGTPLTQPIDVRAAGVVLNIEWQDTSTTVEAARAILTTAAADNLRVNLKYIGFTGGSGCVNAIRLVGCDNAIINCDFYGKASTGWVEFLTTACTNIEVTGYMYNSGTTNGSKDVVDTATGSTWYASVYDGSAGQLFGGGSATAFSSGGSSAVVALKAAAIIVNGDTLFTVTGGPIKIEALVSICVTANDATASTLQYSATPTVGTATTISGASASLASAAAGASVTLAGTALATAALLNANGPNLIANPGTVMIPAGTIKAVVGVGSTTGTWRHYIRFTALAAGVTVA